MNKQITRITPLLILITVLFTILLSGCTSSKNIKVKTPEAELIKDKSKSYIIFTNIEANPIRSFSSKIMEYDRLTKRLTYLGTFIDNEKYLHVINPGKHYFFIDTNYGNSFIPSERLIVINAEAGKIYNVNSLVGVILNENRKNTIQKIKNSSCSTVELSKFGFINNLEESDLLSFEIDCKNGKINTISDTSFFTLKKINKATFVKPTQEELDKFDKVENVKKSRNGNSSQIITKVSPRDSYKGRIDELSSDYIDIHKNILQKVNRFSSATSNYSVSIIKYTENKYANKYNSAVLSSLNNIGNMSKEHMQDLNKDILEELKDKQIKIGDGVLVKYKINNYIHGNQAIRYAGFTELQRLSGMSSIDINIIFIDSKTNTLIGEINYVAYIDGGLFGGSVGLISDVSDYIATYLKFNFMK